MLFRRDGLTLRENARPDRFERFVVSAFCSNENAHSELDDLIDRIAALPNVEIHVAEELIAQEGNRSVGLTAATFESKGSGGSRRPELRHLFLFVGTNPNSNWCEIASKPMGAASWSLAADLFRSKRTCRASSQQGMFARDSTKRVAAAVGEGAAILSTIHAKLAAQATVS